MTLERKWPTSLALDGEASFLESTKRFPLLVLHLWAPWNGDDAILDQRLQELPAMVLQQIELRSLNTETTFGQKVCLDLEVMNLPALAVFVQGKLVDVIIGLRERPQLEFLARHWIDWLARS